MLQAVFKTGFPLKQSVPILPSVVATILMIQNSRVISGTLLKAFSGGFNGFTSTQLRIFKELELID
jgi:hypothetical protein